MRLLVIHSWLKGNLGDVLQLSVLLSALRQRKPAVLDLAGYPPRPAPETAELIAAADRFLPEPFPWYWSLAPRPIGDLLFASAWQRRRRALFSRYDALICAPGPYLASYDPRAVSALNDIRIAAELGVRVVLANHSIGPLDRSALATLAHATVRVAREATTYEYLAGAGLPVVRSADFAFLYPYRLSTGAPPIAPPYRVVFLRSNNLPLRRLRTAEGGLFDGSRVVVPPAPGRLVLATSDRRRDARFIGAAARQLALPAVVCESVGHMVRLIAGSSGVVSDRYHPAICAAVLGKPVQVLGNREPHKMEGLQQLLSRHPVAELQGMARAGLDAVQNALRES